MLDLIPVPIRKDLSVILYNVPWDMTWKEASKLARVIMAMRRYPKRGEHGRFAKVYEIER